MDTLEQALSRYSSHRAAAEALGVSPQLLSGWLTGRRGISAERVLDVARTLGLRPYDLRPDLYPDPEWRAPEA